MAFDGFPTNQDGQGIDWGKVGKGIEPWIPAIGTVVGTVIDKQASDAANRANARNVAAQIDFQREQSETAYQRAVDDLRKAGLNPAMAYKQGGNSSQGGAAADTKPTIQNAGAKLSLMVDAYNNFATGTAQRQLIREQASKTAAETGLVRGQTAVIAPEAIRGQSADYIRERYLADLAKARGDRATAENIPTRLTLENAATAQTTATARQQEELMRTQSTLNEQEFMNEWFAKNVAPYLSSTAKAIRALRGK